MWKRLKFALVKVFAAAAIGCTSFTVWADTWTDPDTGYTWTYRINGDTAEIYGTYLQYPTHVPALYPEPGGRADHTFHVSRKACDDYREICILWL